MKKVLGYLLSENRRKKNETYGEWIYDNSTHHVMSNVFGYGLKTFCGIKKETYSLNHYDVSKITCKTCQKRYKYLWWIYNLNVVYEKMMWMWNGIKCRFSK